MDYLFTEKVWEFTYEKAWKKKLSFASTVLVDLLSENVS